MNARDSGIEIFVLVEDAGAKINGVAVGIARGERRVVVALAKDKILVFECTVHKSKLCTHGKATAKQFESIGIVEIEVLVRETANLVVHHTKAKAMVALDERDGGIDIYKHCLGVVLEARELVSICRICRQFPLCTCSGRVVEVLHLPVVGKVRVELCLHLPCDANH